MGPQFIAVLGEIGAEGLVRIPLAKLGRWFKGALKFAITRADLATVIANFAKRKADVVIDYDHGTEYSAGSGQPVPAAGWLKEIEPQSDDQGILWGLAEFTEKARAMLAAREYKYISPVINWGARDKATGEQQGATITSVALTNVPVLEEMPAIALSEAGWMVEEASTERSKAMVKKLILADRAACTARAILEDGTETVLSVEGLNPEPKVIRLSEVKRAADGRFDFAALSESEHAIAPEVFRAMTVQQELDAAIQAGKVTPAQRPSIEKLALSDLAAFREFIAAQKNQVDLSERGIAGGAEGGGDLKKVDGRIRQLVAERQKAQTGLSYGDALRVVLSEHPDLEKRRRELMG
jgi:phage I-like protein